MESASVTMCTTNTVSVGHTPSVMKMVFSVVPYVCCAISYATATDQLHSGGARALITDGNLAHCVKIGGQALELAL